MTIRPDREPVPGRNDDKSSQHDGRHQEARPLPSASEPATTGNHREPSRQDERQDERQAVLAFANRILTSSANTTRAIALLAAILFVVLLAVGLFQIRVDVGPIHIAPVPGQSAQP
jgi:hypothetical protein